MDITAAAPLNSCPDETHHLVSLRLSGFYVGKCGTERWKSAWSSCERWTWLPMSSSLSGTLSSGNMEVESAWECSLKSRRKLPFMDLSSAFHGCDSVGLIELLQIPTPILTNFFFYLWDNTSSKFRYSNILMSLSFKNNDDVPACVSVV